MTKVLFSALAILAMATNASATLLSTFAIQGDGPNANVVVTPADLIANPSFVPVALGAGDVVTNGSLGNAQFGAAPLALENGLTISQSNQGNANGAFSFSQPATANANPILQNYLAVTNGFGPALVNPGTITIGGLDDGLSYNIHLLAAGDSAGQGSIFTLGSESQTTLVADPSLADATLGQNLVSFFGVTPAPGEDEVTFDIAGLNGTFFFLSGGQIEVIPEPGSLMLLGLAGVAGMIRRRK